MASKVTARQIVNLVISEVTLPEPNGWEKVLASVENDLMLIHGIRLDTKLEEA